MMRRILCVFLLFSSAQCLAAIEFPALTGRVVDTAGLLSSKATNKVTRLLTRHEEKTTNQIVVVTLTDLQGRTIEEYGYQLGRHWGVGQKERNNGVLLLVAKNERKLRIEVGYGLEGALTDAMAGNIIQTVIRPQFKKGNFDQGVFRGVNAIIAAIKGEYQAKEVKKSNDKGNWLIVTLVIGIFLFITLPGSFGGRFGGRHSHYSGGSGGGFSGGGFSGGGGSFGGGGASGGW